MNSYLRDFRLQIRSRFAEDTEDMKMSDWIMKNTKLRKKPFSFDHGFEFQKAIADDMSKNLAVIKCSQIGLTEIQLRKFAAFLARTTAVNGIYTMPDDNMMKRISQTRFAPIINDEKVFNLGFDKPIRSIQLYQINQSFGYFTGNKESDATSINADLLFHDELDLSDQGMIGLFQSRLQGSNYRITHSFSTPTFEGFGIDAVYKGSDQHEYLIRCEKCNHHNLPDFTPDYISIPGLSSDINDLSEIDSDIASRLSLDQAYIRCSKCSSKLDTLNPTLWSWVPRYPARRSRGYRVHPFCIPSLDVEYIVDQLLKYKQKDRLRSFYNTVLGKPYNDGSARISEEEIRSVMKSSSKFEPTTEPIFIGIDVGITCHMVMIHMGSGKPVAFSWKQILADNLVDELEEILKNYNVIGGIIDRYPYTTLSNEIRDLSNGRIIPVEYSGSPTAATLAFVKDEFDEISHIRANRTHMIDAVANFIKKRKIDFIGYQNLDHLIVQHLRNMVRIEKDDQTVVWNKLDDQDHFFHALGYALFSVRTNDALLYKSDMDERTEVSFSPVTFMQQNDADMGMKSRKTTTISLGMI